EGSIGLVGEKGPGRASAARLHEEELVVTDSGAVRVSPRVPEGPERGADPGRRGILECLQLLTAASVGNQKSPAVWRNRQGERIHQTRDGRKEGQRSIRPHAILLDCWAIVLAVGDPQLIVAVHRQCPRRR